MESETAQGFYDRFAGTFDAMVDWPARIKKEEPLLREVFRRAKAGRILDAGCGTGWHAIEFARWGYEVVGVDLSPQMVEMARGNALDTGVGVAFEVGGFDDLSKMFGPKFDVVLCIGNSLPHLTTEDALQKAIRNFHAVLRPGGFVVIQNLNYDRQMAQKRRFFPAKGGEINGVETLIWRFADYREDGLIQFHVAIFQKIEGPWHVEVHSTPQRPFLREDALTRFSEAGFEEIELYGGYDQTAFNMEGSGDLIVVARKPEEK